MKRWIKKVGLAGLLFLTAKGLLWLAIPLLVAKCAS